MTAAQSLKIYEVLEKHFGNTADATTVVTEIEQIIEAKLEAQKDVLATKDDIRRLDVRIAEVQTGLYEKLNDQFKWLVGIIVAVVSLAVAIIKLV